MPEAFELKKQVRVLEVTLCRGKANTITAEDSRELNRMWESFRDHEAQRFAILTGKGEKFFCACLLYTSPSPRDATLSRMPSSA